MCVGFGWRTFFIFNVYKDIDMKISKRILALCLAVCSALILFTVCNSENGCHTCIYNRKVTSTAYQFGEATCLKKATYFFSCECGAKGTETFVYGTFKNHIYENGKCKWCNVTKPTIPTPSNPTPSSPPMQSDEISRLVYITPTGKRYHHSKRCAGKNATPATKNRAAQLGLTRCKKCA